jgi:hypothetical protein
MKTLIGAALLAVTFSGGPSFAGDARCQSTLTGGLEATSQMCPAQPLILAQMKMRSSSGDTQTLTRVPRGQTYQIQMGNQTAFQKFAAGATLPGTDCVQITCPSSFDPDITCWKCVESVAAPAAPSD